MDKLKELTTGCDKLTKKFNIYIFHLLFYTKRFHLVFDEDPAKLFYISCFFDI